MDSSHRRGIQFRRNSLVSGKYRSADRRQFDSRLINLFVISRHWSLTPHPCLPAVAALTSSFRQTSPPPTPRVLSSGRQRLISDVECCDILNENCWGDKNTHGILASGYSRFFRQKQTNSLSGGPDPSWKAAGGNGDCIDG
jgi:hypothetical protein